MMQKPDADGFVTITWPSKTIPHGGIFHTRRVEPTARQKEFIQVLLEESKMAIAQRNKSEYMLRQEVEPTPEPEIQMPLVRPRTSKRRSLSAIRQSGIYEDEPYVPLKRGEDREKLKDKLANTMAYGNGPDQKPPPPPRIPKPKPKIPTAKEKWHDLLTQIRERAEWLAEMEALGQAENHRDIIENQIAERLRAMDALGIDSECFSARSGSTLRSRELTARSNGSNRSKRSNRSVTSNKLNTKTEEKSARPQGKLKSPHSGGRTEEKEENISAYIKVSPLKYSPRRRV